MTESTDKPDVKIIQSDDGPGVHLVVAYRGGAVAAISMTEVHARWVIARWQKMFCSFVPDYTPPPKDAGVVAVASEDFGIDLYNALAVFIQRPVPRTDPNQEERDRLLKRLVEMGEQQLRESDTFRPWNRPEDNEDNAEVDR